MSGVVVSTVFTDSEDELPMELPSHRKSRRHTSTTKSEEDEDDDDSHMEEEEDIPRAPQHEEEEEDYEEEEENQDWVPVQLHTKDAEESDNVSSISDEPSSSSSSEASSVSETQDFLSNQNMYQTDDDPNTLSLLESSHDEDDILLDEEDFLVHVKLDDDDDYLQEDEDIINSGHQHLISTELLQPLDPPTNMSHDSPPKKAPLVFASDMLARRYDNDDQEEVESTKQQDPLDSPYAKLRKTAPTLEKVIDSNIHRKEHKKKKGKHHTAPPPPPYKKRDEEGEDDEEKKRNEFMAWRREGIPEYIEFVFGTDDCPTDDEDEKHKKKHQPQPARRRLNPPPPPSKPIIGGEPLQATPVKTAKKNSRFPANARDMSGNNTKDQQPETKMQGLYKKYRIRASKSGTAKPFQRPSDVSAEKKKEDHPQHERQRSLSPVLGGSSQNFKPKPEKHAHNNASTPSSPFTKDEEHIAMVDGGDRGKLSAKKSFSKIKKGGAKKLQSLRKLLGEKSSGEPIPKRSSYSENPKHHNQQHRSSAPEPVIAVPVALKRGRSAGRNSTGNNITRRTPQSRDNSVDENPYTVNSGGGRKGRRARASTSPSNARSVNTASGKVQAAATESTRSSPRVPAFRKQASQKSLNSITSGPADFYVGNKAQPMPPMRTNSVRVKSVADISAPMPPMRTNSVRVKAPADMPSPIVGARRGRRSGGRPSTKR